MAENNETQAAPVKARIRATNDIYTSLLGLTVLCLLATIVFVCIYSYQSFGSFEAIIIPS